MRSERSPRTTPRASAPSGLPERDRDVRQAGAPARCGAPVSIMGDKSWSPSPGSPVTSPPSSAAPPPQQPQREPPREAVRRGQAVISALGPDMSRKATGLPLVEGTRLIVSSMQGHQIQRFIGMATPSVLDPRDRRTLQPRISTLLARTFLPRAYDEIVGMSKIIMSSDRTWTIVRFLAPATGPRDDTFGAASSAPTRSAGPSPGPTSPTSSPASSTTSSTSTPHQRPATEIDYSVATGLPRTPLLRTSENFTSTQSGE